MQNDYNWLLKKSPRSVINLRLWHNNPRLDPENTYSHLKEFVEEMTSTTADRTDFINLAKSIVKKSFIPADPVVVWQDVNNKKYYVAEGNRRIAVLKLLLEPAKAPKSIKNIFTKLSAEIDKASLEKIPVSIAPSFEHAEWYISQRNSTSSLHKRWAREQQQKWVAILYDKYSGDLETIRSQAGVEESDLETILRTLKIKELVKEVKNELSESEYERASSYRFPISSLERFFGTKKVKEEWGLEYVGSDIKITKDRPSFLKAYAHLLKGMLLPVTDKNRIDSRSITDKLDSILESLPKVKPSTDNCDDAVIDADKNSEDEQPVSIEDKVATDGDPILAEKPIKRDLKNDPNRSRLILDCYFLQTDNFRLLELFNELKTIPLKYTNSVAASIRIFLDLGVLTYLESESLIKDVEAYGKTNLRQITLSKRIEFLKAHFRTNTKVSSVIQKLLNPENELSLDVLNGYVHNSDAHYLNPPFLNKFWDSLFPFFIVLLDIKENKQSN